MFLSSISKRTQKSDGRGGGVGGGNRDGTVTVVRDLPPTNMAADLIP